MMIGRPARLMAVVLAVPGLAVNHESAIAQERPASTTPSPRFPVAHHHSMSWCYGYLSLDADSVRYEVAQPAADREHSFKVRHSDLQARRWVIFGNPQEAVELRIGGSVYHFRVLANETEVRSGPARRASPPEAVSPEPLLAALRDPVAAIAAQRYAPTSPLSNPGAPAAGPVAPQRAADVQAGGNEGSRNLTPGMLDGVYIGLEFSKFYAGSINHRFLIFYPDGWVQDGMPGAGLDGFSFVSYRSNPTNQGSVGRYRVEGMQISMIWQEWPTDREFIRLDVNAADFREPSVYIAACRCTGTRFAGVYEWDEKSTLEFSLEGTFVDRRVIDQLDTDLGFFNTPRVRHGTYLIQNNSLILTYSDGQRLKTSFAASALGEQRQTVDWISIFSYQILYRRGYRPPP